jgi:hypothetical protein
MSNHRWTEFWTTTAPVHAGHCRSLNACVQWGAHKTIRLRTYVAPRLLDQRPIHAVHLVVEAASVAQVVAGAVAAPQRRRHGAAVDALASVRERQVAVSHY